MPGSRRSRKAANSASVSTGRPPPASRNEVMDAASSGGKSAGSQSTLTPRPMTARGSGLPRPSVSPSTPATLRRSAGEPEAVAVAMTRSFGHLSRTDPAASPVVASAASAMASDATAARRQT